MRSASGGGPRLAGRGTRPAAATLACAGLLITSAPLSGSAQALDGEPGGFEVDAAWPGPLPDAWILGQVAGIAVDQDDHVWIVHRPRSLTAHEAAAVQNPPTGDCCVPAPSVIEFDAEGRFVQGWGGPRWDQDTSAWLEAENDWPATEHGIFVDAERNVWLAGNGENDHQVLKFSADGTHLLTIGQPGETGGSNDIARLGQPADVAVDVEAREVFVADGYGNRRVIVFDMDTGEYRRHWGAYGDTPSDEPLPDYQPGSTPARQFRGPVHAVALSGEGTLYVADRTGNRIQEFELDGRFVREASIADWTLDQGAVWDIARSAGDGGDRIFVADGHNKKIWILDPDDLSVMGSFGRGGRQAGQFEWVHNVAIDSSGNVYTSEVNTGKRVQMFRPVPAP